MYRCTYLVHQVFRSLVLFYLCVCSPLLLSVVLYLFISPCLSFFRYFCMCYPSLEVCSVFVYYYCMYFFMQSFGYVVRSLVRQFFLYFSVSLLYVCMLLVSFFIQVFRAFFMYFFMYQVMSLFLSAVRYVCMQLFLELVGAFVRSFVLPRCVLLQLCVCDLFSCSVRQFFMYVFSSSVSSVVSYFVRSLIIAFGHSLCRCCRCFFMYGFMYRFFSLSLPSFLLYVYMLGRFGCSYSFVSYLVRSVACRFLFVFKHKYVYSPCFFLYVFSWVVIP